jgi:hypothetical protein
MRGRNRIVMLALVAVFLRLSDQPAAAPFAVVCEDVCAGAATCNAQCWMTQFEFDNDYPSTTCEGAGYTDCCGNDECNPDTEGCNVCPGDCGYVSECEIECWANSQCDSGEVCNAAHECVFVPPADTGGGQHPPCGGECDSNSDCCGTDVCNGVSGGYKWCGVPQTTYCPSSPSCTTSDDCDDVSCPQGQEQKDMFCDPGIGRCQFRYGFDCPTSTNMCQPVF